MKKSQIVITFEHDDSIVLEFEKLSDYKKDFMQSRTDCMKSFFVINGVVT